MTDTLSPSPWPWRQEELRQNPITPVSERERILAFIEETAQRYSRGSVTRVALDNLALEIMERLERK
jgi:hypothetical protein